MKPDKDGFVTVPDTPGIGYELNMELLKLPTFYTKRLLTPYVVYADGEVVSDYLCWVKLAT